MVDPQPLTTSTVVYVSEASCSFNSEQIAELAEQASSNNASIDVTGYLYFSRGRFMQCLEGGRRDVADLLTRIDRDSRHTIVAKTWAPDLGERRFPRWSMRWVRETEITEIGLEQILVDQIMLNEKIGWHEDGLDKAIWRMMDTVAKAIHNEHS